VAEALNKKTEAEQLAFDQTSQFAVRPGDHAWKVQVAASLEKASMGTGSYARWEREIIRALFNATGVREISKRLTFDVMPTRAVRRELQDRLVWLVEAAEQYGGLHVITGRELDFPTSIDRRNPPGIHGR
jgi:hypothetical protein